MDNANKLKSLMVLKGMTYEELAKKLGIAVTTLSRKINGKYDWTLGELKKMQVIFGKQEVADIFLG